MQCCGVRPGAGVCGPKGLAQGLPQLHHVLPDARLLPAQRGTACFIIPYRNQVCVYILVRNYEMGVTYNVKITNNNEKLLI